VLEVGGFNQNTGMYLLLILFSRTNSSVCLAHTAIVISCNDLPAVQKVSQLGAVTSHNYCTVCQCHHKSTLGRVDFMHIDCVRGTSLDLSSFLFLTPFSLYSYSSFSSVTYLLVVLVVTVTIMVTVM
jgi:hypothetical protein